MDAAEPSDLDVDELTWAIEDFNTVFIRLATVEQFSFSTLSVLHSLSRRGPMRVTDLVATEQIKQPALTSLINKLEAKGLVHREPDPADRRAVLLSLTAAGEHIVQSRHDDRATKLAHLIGRLSQRERTTLSRIGPVLQGLVAIPAEEPHPAAGE